MAKQNINACKNIIVGESQLSAPFCALARQIIVEYVQSGTVKIYCMYGTVHFKLVISKWARQDFER